MHLVHAARLGRRHLRVAMLHSSLRIDLRLSRFAGFRIESDLQAVSLSMLSLHCIADGRDLEKLASFAGDAHASHLMCQHNIPFMFWDAATTELVQLVAVLIRDMAERLRPNGAIGHPIFSLRQGEHHITLAGLHAVPFFVDDFETAELATDAGIVYVETVPLGWRHDWSAHE